MIPERISRCQFLFARNKHMLKRHKTAFVCKRFLQIHKTHSTINIDWITSNLNTDKFSWSRNIKKCQKQLEDFVRRYRMAVFYTSGKFYFATWEMEQLPVHGVQKFLHYRSKTTTKICLKHQVSWQQPGMSENRSMHSLKPNVNSWSRSCCNMAIPMQSGNEELPSSNVSHKWNILCNGNTSADSENTNQTCILTIGVARSAQSFSFFRNLHVET